MLPLALNLHFSRVHFFTLVADAVTNTSKNHVTAKKLNHESRKNHAGAGGTRILRGSQTRALRAIIQVREH